MVKTIRSTDAQNNFGQIISDASSNRTRYIVERHGIPQVVLLSFDDFSDLLTGATDREQMVSVLREARPHYGLGRVIHPEANTVETAEDRP